MPLGLLASKTPRPYRAFVVGDPPDHVTVFELPADHVSFGVGDMIVGKELYCVVEVV